MSKRRKKIIISIVVIVCAAVFTAVWLMVCGYLWTWGPFSGMANIRYKSLAGNADTYAVENVDKLESSPLEGMNVCFLGSSVTYGADSLQTSFVEYLEARDGITATKEAVSGTTLVDSGSSSYISRMKKLDKSAAYDLFICQLSTNDATQNKNLGTAEDTGTDTVCGAINYIISYVKDTWGCPVVFFTNSCYESEPYAAMVTALNETAAKTGTGVIDMYSDADFNNITEEQRSLYMADSIHPTKAGYLEWWTPYLEEYLYSFVQNMQK